MAAPPRPRVSPLLWLGAATLALGGQLRREWRAGPFHRLAIAGPNPKGLAARPHDPRPANPAAGERLLQGRFDLAGETLDPGPGGDPWNLACPSRAFAEALHGFGWLPDLLAVDEAGPREALRLWLHWRRQFGRPAAFGWTGLALERRLFHLACAAPALLPLASELEGALYLGDLARQARHLRRDPGDPGRVLERLAAQALAGVTLAGPAGERLMRGALRRLERLAAEAVLPDGVHATRSPERGLELLFDLLTLDDALSQRGAPAPVEIARAIDRLSGAVRFFALPVRRAPRFHGGEAAAPERVARALALDAARAAPVKGAPYGAFERLQSQRLSVAADVGRPPEGGWSTAACAQPASVEIACGGRRLIVASAWSAAAPATAERLRGPEGGSCLALGEAWPATPLRGLPARTFGACLVGGEAAIKAVRQETDDAVWVEIASEAWRRPFGFDHARRLFLDLAADELRGEDQLTPAARGRPRGPVPYAIRFQLAPQVSASVAVDGRSALIKPPGGAAWRLRSDAPQTSLQPGVLFEDGAHHQIQVLTLLGEVSPTAGAKVRWKLSRDEAEPPA